MHQPGHRGQGLNLLVEEGILYKRRGLGMFVSEGAAERIRAKRREEFLEQYVKPLAAEARKLGLTAEELQAMLQAACRQEE